MSEFHGATAPSSIDKDSSGIKVARSTVRTIPVPSHLLQAPWLLNDVIAYHVRQSFKPGEITPEEANRLGCEFAERFLKGNHAYIVCTHIDKKHIHNHIIWNSITLDCKHKFCDFLGSGRAVARLSDVICTEHRLSVIAAPKRGKNHYGRWLGNKAKPPTGSCSAAS